MKKRKSRLKTYMVKYCETVHHFYYKYVDAQNSDSAEKANLNMMTGMNITIQLWKIENLLKFIIVIQKKWNMNYNVLYNF